MGDVRTGAEGFFAGFSLNLTTTSASVVALLPAGTGSTYEAEYVLSDDGAYALVSGYTKVPFANSQHWTRVVLFNPDDLAISTDELVGGLRTSPSTLRIGAGLAGGGLYVTGATETHTINSSLQGDLPGGGHSWEMASGLWALWDAGPSLTLAPHAPNAATAWAQARGNAQAANAPARLEMALFVGQDVLVDEQGPPPLIVTVDDFLVDVRRRITLGELSATPRFYIRDEASVAPFLASALETTGLLGFVGHSISIPSFGAIGLRFYDKDLLREMTPQGYGPRGPSLSVLMPEIPSKARIVFIAACTLGDTFKGLWEINETTADRALIVPTSESTPGLNEAAWAWFQVARALARGRTAEQAVTDANNWLQGSASSVRYRVIGGGNVKIR